MSKRAKSTRQVGPPVIGRPDALPLLDRNFSWDRFEGFIRHLIRAQPSVKYIKRYGKRGSRQRGIDLIAVLNNGTRWVFQCKQRSSFALKDAKRAVTKATYPAQKYFLVIACDTDSSVHDYIDARPNWELWDCSRVSDEVVKLPRESARDLVTQFFGPDWCKAFLGIGASSPFLPWKVFFARWLNGDRLFNHTWQLVGRRELISALDRFCHDNSKQVALLIGRGGIGKSKILHAFAESYSSKCPEGLLWFVEEDIPLTQQSVDELPQRPCLIIVDDAHRFNDLRPLFTAVVQPGSKKKLLLSGRPQRLDFLKAELTRAGFDYSTISELPELKPLTRDEVKELARQVLGPRLAHLDHRLATATWDCPLVTVVGGKLLANESIDPRLLATHDGFRAEVLNRFQDVIIGRFGNGQNSQFYSELLQVLSATAPFPPENGEFVKTTANFLQVTAERIVNAIGEFERDGVLVRRSSRFLRIAPDVVADHILHQACVAANGQPNGYAERIFAAFAAVHPEKVFLNLAELDWRIQSSSKDRKPLLANIWADLEKLLLMGTSQEQSWVIRLVIEVSYYQPEQALRVAELVIKRLPASSIRKHGRRKVPWNDDIIRALPEILRRCAYTLEFLPKAARCLWELGKRDEPQFGQHSEGPFPVLIKLAAYGSEKPLKFSASLLNTVVPWLGEQNIHEQVHSVIDILDQFLAKAGEDRWSEGSLFSWRPFAVSRENTLRLREEALAAICSCAESGNQKTILRVLDSLESLLRPFLGAELGTATEGEIQKWVPDQLAAAAAIERIIQRSNDPIIHYRCLQALRQHWQVEENPLVLEACAKAAERAPKTLEIRLLLALAGSHWILPKQRSRGQGFDWESQERELRRFHDEVSKELLDKKRTGAAGFRLVSSLISQLQLAEIHFFEMTFLSVLASVDTNYAAQFCTSLVRRPSSPVSCSLHVFLIALEPSKPNEALSLARKAISSGVRDLCSSVAAYLDWVARNRILKDGELKVLKSLLKHRDEVVMSSALHVIWGIGRRTPRLAIKLLLDSQWEHETRLTSVALSCIDATHGIPPTSLQDEEIKTLLKRLEKTPDIEDTQVGEFIEQLSVRLPKEVTALFVNRIIKSTKEKSSDYRPLPLEFRHAMPDLSKHSDGLTVLRRLRDMMLKRPWQYRHHVRELYWHLTPEAIGLLVLQEWFISKDKKRFCLALSVLENRAPEFVFANPGVIEDVLNLAREFDGKTYEIAQSALVGCAIQEGGVRNIGEPEPNIILRRQQASELAAKHPIGSTMREFYDEIIKAIDRRFTWQQLREEELFGED